jgi:NACHT domain
LGVVTWFHRSVTGIEVAAISLGAVVVKSASKIWLGDRPFAADVTSDLVDALAGRVTSTFDRRRISRFFDDCADIVAKRLAALMDAEFRSVPDNERDAALFAVRDTFTRTALTDEALFRADLDARLVERQLRPNIALVLAQALLSEGGEQVYWLVLRESCAYLVEVVTTLPKFQAGALTELLRRDSSILASLTRILDRLPERRGVDDFAADYCRVVANKLDRMELLGVTLADANRRYPLSIAYIDLSVVRRGRGGLLLTAGEQGTASSSARRAESVLAGERRVLVTGPAGSGKTTLLQWFAVRSARGDFAGPLAGLNGTVPFFIPLRRYVDRDLPAPQEFPLAVGVHIADEMPQGWVHQLLRAGQALILVDGVDEMPESQRDRVRSWLSDLVETFHSVRCVVTSRPTAIDEGWLDRLRFTTTELQQMSRTDVAEFVGQWHAAVGAELLDADEKASLGGYERSLLAAINADRHLRALAVSPLLCALLCAVNRERRSHLPGDRMETYSAALDMLLDRRDAERGVTTGGVSLSRSDKVQLLQDFAFWLVRNGWSDAPVERVVGQIARTAQQLRSNSADPRDVFRSLLERSGLLREPVVGRIDFVHRTFQEYLAGKAAVESDEIGLLVKNAHDTQWREVVVMAAGHAQPEQCTELLTGLLRRGRRRGKQSWLWALAVASAQSARRIDPQLRAEIDKVAQRLVPPATEEAAEALAGIGEVLLRLLSAKPPRTVGEATASIRAVSAIGSHSAMTMIGQILVSHGEPIDGSVASAVLNSWRFFKPEEYLAEVLVPFWPRERELQVSEPAFLAVLSQFRDLRAVRCELGNFGVMGADVRALALNQKLRSVSLAGCDAGLDLSPLQQLPLLETVTLNCIDKLPDLIPLADVRGLRSLTLACGTAAASLSAIARFSSLMRLELLGCHDVSGFVDLQVPRSLENLILSGFNNLSSLSGVECWENVKTLELFECPRLSDLAPVSGMKSLAKIGIGILQVGTVNLSPLAELSRLREITLMGFNAFDLTPLRGMRDIVIRVPVNSALVGAKELGLGAAVTEFVVAPRMNAYLPPEKQNADS